MYRFIISFITLLLPLSARADYAGELLTTKIELSPGAIERGEEVFMTTCRLCHGLEFWRGMENPEGIKPLMDPQAAKAAFPIEPPDLSVIAKARGRRLNGALYIYQLLTTYYEAEDGTFKNMAYGSWNKTDGTITMPPPFSPDDPELETKARDVSAFLYHVAEPTASERKRLGRYVLVYMVILTGLLYAINRRVWKGIDKKLE